MRYINLHLHYITLHYITQQNPVLLNSASKKCQSMTMPYTRSARISQTSAIVRYTADQHFSAEGSFSYQLLKKGGDGSSQLKKFRSVSNLPLLRYLRKQYSYSLKNTFLLLKPCPSTSQHTGLSTVLRRRPLRSTTIF